MADHRATLRRALVQARVSAHAARHLGLRTVGLIIANSARRHWEGPRRGRPAGHSAAPVAPGPLRRVEVWHPERGAARFEFEHAELEVAFLADDVVRLSWGPGEAPVPYALAGATGWTTPEVRAHPLDTMRAQDGGWVMCTDALHVTVSPDGSLRIARADGAVLRYQAPPLRSGVGWEQAHGLRPGERLCGLGEQSAGVDLRGGRYELWNRDPGGSWGPGESPLYLGIPVVVSTHPDGDLLCFYENSTHAVFGFAAPDTDTEGSPPGTKGARAQSQAATVTFAGGVLRQYVMSGPVPHLLDRFSALTGRPALPPRWALGYHQSRWGYRCDADVRGVATGFAAHAVPLSVLHLDIDYIRGYRVFTVDGERFPDLRGLAGNLADQGTRLVTIVDPGVKVDDAYPLYREGSAEHRFCTDGRGRSAEGVVWPGRCAYPDFTDPHTRTWWAAQYRTLTDAGVAGIWHDMNEPTSLALLGDPTLPISTRHAFEGRGGDHGEGHNLYGLLMNRAGHEGLGAALPGRRPFIVSRSGWAGVQRYAWNWTGDVASTWESLRQQVATVIGLGLSGVAYSGSDIGGFSGAPDDELFLRWLQMSVFMPFCRTHSVLGVPPREPWCFTEPTRRAVISWIRFRYRLLPYLYTLAHGASATGAPLVRPVWWPAPGVGPPGEGSGAPAPHAEDAFLLGDAVLVAPVCEPGAAHRRVPMPAGSWASLWGDALRRDAAAGGAGATVRCEAPGLRLPVLVRHGSVVPLDDGWADPGGSCVVDGDRVDSGPPAALSPGPPLALDHAPRHLAFHCWPTAGGEATGECVDDAGDGDGPVRRDVVRLEGAVAGGRAQVVWERSGDFPPPPRLSVVVHGLEAERAQVDGVDVAVSGGTVECGPFTVLTLDGLREPVQAP